MRNTLICEIIDATRDNIDKISTSLEDGKYTNKLCKTTQLECNPENKKQRTIL